MDCIKTRLNCRKCGASQAQFGARVCISIIFSPAARALSATKYGKSFTLFPFAFANINARLNLANGRCNVIDFFWFALSILDAATNIGKWHITAVSYRFCLSNDFYFARKIHTRWINLMKISLNPLVIDDQDQRANKVICCFLLLISNSAKMRSTDDNVNYNKVEKWTKSIANEHGN